MKKINDNEFYTDILIIGGGSGGFGAAYSAGKTANDLGLDLSVTLVEKNNFIGGVSTYGGVNCWEPGVSGNGIHFEIARELLEAKHAGIGGYEGVVCRERPYSLSVIHDEYKYEDTLFRLKIPDTYNLRRLHFEPDAMNEIMIKKLHKYNVKILFNTEFVDSTLHNDNIESVFVKINNDIVNIKAKIFIDCTGNIILARKTGCQYMYGEDPKSAFDEFCAPEYPSNHLNGATLLFRVEKCEENFVETIPDFYKNFFPKIEEWYKNNVEQYRVYSQCNQYPNGDLNINMLPTIDGFEYLELKNDVMNILTARVWYYFTWLQSEIGFGHKMKYIFKYPSAREDYRLKGQYVLTELDIRNGCHKKEEIIAYADHVLDIHGKSNINVHGVPKYDNPYGIPYSCLLPVEIGNLLVACRGASFSHIAASSCRLSRTMIAIGEAAGTAAVLSVKHDKMLKNLNVEEVRELLQI